jgi:hypothetical protein
LQLYEALPYASLQTTYLICAVTTVWVQLVDFLGRLSWHQLQWQGLEEIVEDIEQKNPYVPGLVLVEKVKMQPELRHLL